MKNQAKRTDPLERKEQILNAALKIAAATGLASVTAIKVANLVGVSRPLVQHYLGGRSLRSAIAEHAAKHLDAEILAQCLLAGEAVPKGAKKDLVKRAKAIAKSKITYQ